MEKRTSEGLVNQMKNNEQFKSVTMGTRRDGPAPAGQRIPQDPPSSISANDRLPDFHVSSGVKPVLFSIQTGEEFALEFMRERANSRVPVAPNPSNDRGIGHAYTDLRMLGITHMGSESGSDISTVAALEKGPVKEIEKKSGMEADSRSYYGSTQSVPRSLSGDGSSRGHTYGFMSSQASDSSSTKMKVLCSFGGKILPRPSDGKLRYVGGDTRIIRIKRDISWEELVRKTSSICSQTRVIKYQLPGEDLDSLVSVSCDEDLQNMMEECSESTEGSQKLRMFLFSSSELDDSNFGLGSMDGDSEIQYMVAVNGIDMGSRKNSAGNVVASTSGNDLDQLISLNFGGDRAYKPGMGSTAANGATAPLTDLSVHPPTRIPSTVPMQVNEYESHAPSYHDQMKNIRQTESYPFSAAQTQYEYSSSHYAPAGENVVPVQLHELLSVRQTDGHSPPKNELEQVKSLENTSRSNVAYAPSEVVPGGNNLTSSQCSEKKHDLDDVVNANQVQEPDDDFYYKSGGVPGTGYANSDADQSEGSAYDAPLPPPPPPPVFHSERIPRQQSESMNRLSKSDDSLISQFLMPHIRPAPVSEEPAPESIDPSNEGSLPTKPPYVDTETAGDGLMKYEKYRELADAIAQISQGESEEDLESGKYSPPRQVLRSSNYDEDVSGNAAKKQEDTVSSLPERHRGEMATDSKNVAGVTPPFTWARGSAAGGLPEGSSAQEQGDILIDINDRFPPDLLNGLFSKAILAEEAGIGPLRHDEAGLSLNMPNHEPQHWSFFRNLAQEEFNRKDVSLMDQDHIAFSPPTTNIEDAGPRSYGFSPLKSEGAILGHDDSQADFDERIQNDSAARIQNDSAARIQNDSAARIQNDSAARIQNDSAARIGSDAISSHQGYFATHVLPQDFLEKGVEDVQAEDISFSKIAAELQTTDSEYEDGKVHACHTGGPVIESPVGEFDINDLQIIKNEDLEELRELGSGTFGTVYHGKWRGTDVAIKRIKKSCFTGRSSEQERLTVEFWREAEILSKLHHPNVVAFYGVVQDGPGGTLATVTEFMVNGSLRHVLLRKDRYLDRRKRLIIAMDAAFGMEYLHSKNIVHFDLKCDNLLVNLKDTLRPICKVGDFGLSKIKRNTLVSGGVRGTLPWMAPELLNGSSNKVSEKVDVFSFGIVMWEILTGEEPYANMHYGAIIGGIVNNTLRPPVPSFCDAEWRMLMEQCWAPDPSARPSFTEIASRLRLMSNQSKNQGHQAHK
ncbi:hypothetical protein H6P81_019157 [Aristolochia fimbriata]|uniref:Protein kinase domain-containing protein n=1 Tax=Aristolochia fimbriata TaxID=158543 RepID=A0AAV7DU38_ARIFI|nr:hypothetical protein H6P81_019157 [Aristolochia fimbriata]